MQSTAFSSTARRKVTLAVLLAGVFVLLTSAALPQPSIVPAGVTLATTRGAAAEDIERHAVHAQAGAAQYIWDTTSIDWYYNPAGGPPGSEGWATFVTHAAGNWNAASTAAPRLGGGAAGNGGTEACDLQADGQNTVGWAALGENYLARTCIIYGHRLPDGTPTVAEFDIQVNWHPDDPSFVPWTTTGAALAFDFETVMLHELGHALGLDHAAGCPSAIMCPTIIMGQPQHAPAKADAEALTESILPLGALPTR